MQKANYETLKQEIENTYADEMAKANAKRSKALESLDFLWEAYRNGRGLFDADIDAANKTPEKASSTKRTPEPSLVSAIREAMQNLNEFTRPEVIEWINERYPSLKPKDASVASMLSRLNGKEIEIARKGTGPELFLYRLKSTNGEVN